MTEVVRFCRSRNDGRRCMRELGHRGLHRHRALMWTDAGADALRCPGSGTPSTPAELLENGFPRGRALCHACWTFVVRDADGLLEPHDTWRADVDADAADRRDWFNTFGWSGAQERPPV